jgi:molybdenum cofactor biosynthesis enzyme MoaA
MQKTVKKPPVQLITSKYYCRKNDEPLVKIEGVPLINVYVRLQNVCNANCDFCEFCGEAKQFNEEKFKNLIIRLHRSNKYKINKLSFTGGEPTLDFALFKHMLNFVNDLDDDIFTVVNTNGLHLNELSKMNINSIALSRHHYDDEINQSIFHTKVPTTEEIRNIRKNNVHLSCNLCKDYVGTKDEVLNYLEWCSKCGVQDVGFVGLMNVNDFCKEQFVDYDVLKIPSKRIMQTKRQSKCEGDKITCKCANYVYAGDDNLVSFYCRYYACNNTESVLVYDIDTFKNGFAGDNMDEWLKNIQKGE